MKREKLYVQESGDQVKIGNDLVELGFDLKQNGALISIVDPASGYQFVRDAEAPKTLFGLAVWRQADRQLDWIDGRKGKTFRWTKEATATSVTLSMEVSGFNARDICFRVRITLQKESALSVWRMSVAGLRPEESVHELVCPVVAGVMKVGDEVPGETLVVPHAAEGYAFRNPYPQVDHLPLKTGEAPESPWVGMGEVGGYYPGGGWPMQFMLYYNDVAGLYLACHDEKQKVKGFRVRQFADWGMYPVMSIAHYPGESMGSDAEFNYETIIGVFHGEWWEGADIYKNWARQQKWCEKKLWDRDIAPWLRTGVGIFQMQNYDMPVLQLTHPLEEIAATVNKIAKETGVPFLALIFNYEKGGAWTGPVGLFPPREGDEAFKKAMRKLKDNGNYGFVYIAGGLWYIAISTYDPPFNSWEEFEKHGRDSCVIDAHGKPVINSGPGYNGWEMAQLCPATAYTKKVTESMVLGCVERGCSIVQIDNFPVTDVQDCHHPEHGHPLGLGSWWAEHWNGILADVRKKARDRDRNAALSTESVAECFIQHLDLYDQRAGNMEYFGRMGPGMPMGGELIPIFSYVYGGYVGAYCAAFPECSRPEVLYWARCFGKSLVQGVIPTGGWYLQDGAALNPVTMTFFKKIARAAAQECWKYILFGEMLRPPRIDVPKIDFSYVRLLDLIGFTSDFPKKHPERRHVIQDYAVQHGSFRAMDGTIGHIFVNVSQEVREFDVTLTPHGETGDAYDIDSVTDGQRKAIGRQVQLPATERLRIEPLSLLLIEVRRKTA